MNCIAIFMLITFFQMSSSEQAVEVAGRADELVCCLVRMEHWSCHDGLCVLC